MKNIFNLSLLIAITLIAAIIPLLIGMGYERVQFEVLATATLLILTSIILATLFRNSVIALNIFLALCVYWILDTYLPGDTLGFWASVIFSLVYYYFLNSRLSENVRALLLVFCFTWIAGCLLVTNKGGLTPPLSNPKTEENRQINSTLRPIVHIILDEQMSVRTKPETISKNHPASHFVDDYISNGFRHYSHVRSHSNLTQVSLGEMFLLTNGKNNSLVAESAFTHHVLKNKYFDKLVKSGYRIQGIQSNFLRICVESPNVSCHTYTRANNGHALQRFSKSYKDRFILVLLEINAAYSNKKQSNNVLLYKLAKPILELLRIKPQYNTMYYSRPTLMLEIMDQAENQLNNIDYGQAYFFHLLIPHFPYMLNADCMLKPFQEWSAPSRYGTHEFNNENVYSDYWDQSACAHKRVMQIVAKIKLKSNKLDPIIIIHGDHGARVSAKINKGSSPEMVETFFAVYDKKNNAGEVLEVQELQPLFAQTINKLVTPY